MTVNPGQLPYQITTDAIGGANSRAIQNIFMSMPRTVLATFEQPYSEPMLLATDEEPLGVELIRIIKLQSAQTPVLTGGMVHFTFVNGVGCQVSSIDGLTPNASVTYRYTFRLTYKAQV